jgi:hypothetical protein
MSKKGNMFLINIFPDWGCKTQPCTLCTPLLITTLQNFEEHNTEKVSGEWKKLHNEELHNLNLLFTKYYSDQIKYNTMSHTHIKCTQTLLTKPLGKKFRRPTHKLEDNIKTDLIEIAKCVDWTTHLDRD